MISLVFLASALLLGAAVTRRLGLRLMPFETPALSIVIGLTLWTWLSLLTALLLPYAWSLPTTIVLAAAASVWLWRRGSGWRWQAIPGTKKAVIAWATFSVVIIAGVGYLMWTHYLLPTDNGIFSANATWADFGVHASIISHFAVADRLPSDLPVAAGANISYPFLTNLLSAWLVKGGWNLHMALFVPSLLLLASAVQLLIGFGTRLFGRVGGAIIGLTLVLFTGSAVGSLVAAEDYLQSGQTLVAFLSQLPQDYSIPSQPNAQLSNLVADTLLPQRAFLIGLAVFSAVVVLLTQLRRRPKTSLTIFTGVIIGLLPLMHAHTFLVLMSVLAAFWIETFYRTRKIFNTWSLAGTVAVIFALPQVLWQTLSNRNGTGGHLSLGWTINPGENLVAFWASNYGLLGVLVIGLGVLLIIRQSLRRYLVWYAPFLAIFLFANIYSLQPFAYDNLKLMHYTFLIACLFAGYGAVWLVKRSRLALIPLLLVGVLSSASGALAIAREFQYSHQFASTDDIELADWVRVNTSTTDVFFTTDRPNQPIATLAGRSLVSGYRGWLYSYNLEYDSRLRAIQSALKADMPADNPYKARYLAVASYESPEWTVDRPALDSRYEEVFENPSWTVYSLSP